MDSQIIAQLPAVRTLLVAVDTGSFTETARRLGLTPSGVSKQLARLEELLGARLLERTTRSVRPTLIGLELCQRAGPLLESVEDALRAVQEQREEIAGQVRLSAAPAFGRAVVIPAIHRLGRCHEGLRVEVTLTGRRLDFVEDNIDLAVREGTLRDSSLVARLLSVASVRFYASPSYLQERGKPRGLPDLARHDLVTIPTGSTGLRLHPGLPREGLRPRFQVDDLFSVAELAELGAGVAPLPDYLARSFLSRGTLVPVLPRIEIARLPIHAVYPSRRHLPQRVQAVIDALTEPPRPAARPAPASPPARPAPRGARPRR